jgi:hypothetical protein
MLETLLNEIRAGGTRSGGTVQPALLAARMKVSTTMVVMMLEDLERMGRLARADASAIADAPAGAGEAGLTGEACEETACGGCPVASMCAPKGQGKGRVWVVK